ncbi:MAG: glutamine--fructose-6-phosphate transaminase (isomerizing) [Alphaproteobacteria bacterium]|nr:glutamine--fructose-6-phosphate transaminase (isomerizing) [Alphaproteobacteria bacterium]
MCGIVGIVGQLGKIAGWQPEHRLADGHDGAVNAVDVLLEGLRRLEYRGYDSAGVATLVDGMIERRRAMGKLENLRALLADNPFSQASQIGIGHTRWATHGAPSTRNAHPHQGEGVVVVHNGIIENYRELRDSLTAQGVAFSSDTDTEVIAHLVDRALLRGLSPQQAVAETLPQLHGAFALAMLFDGHNDLLIGARRGSPLCLGFHNADAAGGQVCAHLLASDALALAGMVDRVTYLEEGDWVVLNARQAAIFNADNQVVARPSQPLAMNGQQTDKGLFPHFMLKEIHEQPATVVDSLLPFINPLERQLTIDLPGIDWAKLHHVTLVGCGTAFYVGMVAKYWFEELAGLPAIVDIASEFRYRATHSQMGKLVVFVSQSGETADTLAAMRFAKERGQKTLAIVNVPTSTMAREADIVLHTHAGPEISVASTKATTAQLTVLAALCLSAARGRGAVNAEQLRAHLAAFIDLPGQFASVLAEEGKYRRVGAQLAESRDVLFIGRGSCYPVAMEGALKMKELTYIHAEGFAAGELKHGPIALLDSSVPVVTLAPPDRLQEKTLSNMQEALARSAPIVLLSDQASCDRFAGHAGITPLALPPTNILTAPLVYTLPMQLLAYYCAVAKGTDIDQPRNLAKSVTVE